MKPYILIGASMTLAACGQPETAATSAGAGDWRLASAESRLAFVSTKAGDVAETHTFQDISGAVSAQGQAALEVALASVETGIDIRNERMQAMLFETEIHPIARITADLALDDLQELAVGARAERTTEIDVSLHGVSADFEADLFVTRIGENRVLVETASPVLVHAADFDLVAGLESLREVAGLPEISPAVPVTVSLVFER